MCRRGRQLVPAALVLLLAVAWAGPAWAWQQGERGDPAGVKSMTRGPVHEAFAAPTAANPEPTAAVERKPPEPIEEEAPDYKPEGALWIPGYWEWDQAESNFLWVSGMWRVPPPEMRWIPTYWTEVSDGWQRVPGAWFSTEASEIVYYQTPPASLEVGPSTPSPGDDHFYVPGTWVYSNSDFRWRTGYWTPYRENWVWCPDRWYWTPRGCFYTAGYWDYQPGVRGQVFAPIAFTSTVYLQPGFRWRPWCVIDTNRFYSHLWIGPRAHCYYFGDYYTIASHGGFHPWCDWSYAYRQSYDPLWAWCHVHYGRRGVDFIERTQGWHQFYVRNERERPAVTFVDQQRLVSEGRIDRQRTQNVFADELRVVVSRGDSALRLAKVDSTQRETVRKVTSEIRELHTQRRQTETDTRVVVNAEGRPQRDPSARVEAGGLKLPQVSEEVRKEVRKASAAVTLPKRPDADRGDDDAPRTTRRPDDRTRPGADRPGADRPGADRPGADRPGTDPPETDREPVRPKGKGKASSPDRPSTPDRPGADRPGADRPGTDRPDADRPGADRPETDRESDRPKGKGKGKAPAANRPSGDQPGADRPGSDRPGADRPGAERPATDRPGADRPETDRPDTDREPDRPKGKGKASSPDRPSTPDRPDSVDPRERRDTQPPSTTSRPEAGRRDPSRTERSEPMPDSARSRPRPEPASPAAREGTTPSSPPAKSPPTSSRGKTSKAKEREAREREAKEREAKEREAKEREAKEREAKDQPPNPNRS